MSEHRSALAAEPNAGRDRAEAPSAETVLEFGVKVLGPAAAALQPGDVVELDAFADDPVDLVVGGSLVARGQAVVADGALAMRANEVRSGLLAIPAGRPKRASD
jgi:hypothetical protein